MPRVKRKGHALRPLEPPVTGMTTAELKREFHEQMRRCGEAKPGSGPAWNAFWRQQQITRELDARRLAKKKKVLFGD